ncbi:MAG: T9SS type A sorting domain-containing protein [Gemmatimonadetes bacterium]|nr:T9SS type A sorting domain-containing protein [Gemmatimonadota bacterium]
MFTVSGQADGADVVFSLAEGDEGVTLTENEDGVSATATASSVASATVTATVGDVMSNAVKVSFVPSLHTESTEVTFSDFGAEASASVTAVGFDEGAEVKYTYTASTDFLATEDASGVMITTASAGTVTVTATDGTDSASLTITFMNPAPYLKSDPDPADVIIPEGGEASVTVSATGLEGAVTYQISRTSGTATITANTDGDMVTLTASGEGSADVMVTASAGGMTTEAIAVKFRAMPTVGSDATAVTVPQATVPSGMSMVVATGFPEGAEITFNVEMTSGSASDLTKSVDGNVLTLTATGSVSVSVTASGAGVTTSAVEVVFTQDTPAAPASVAVEDQAGDNGYYVMVSFANSANHGDVSQYRVYREMMVTTTMDADGNVVVSDTPMAAWVPWAVVDAMDNDGMTRAVVPVTDAMATRWGVAAESGMDSAEEMITPAGKRVFSKESVQQLAQFLGLDPNGLVNEDELSAMFMPSADYINSIIGGRKNVVFAALDPDLSVLIGSAAIPQNIRTGGHPIVSSTITAADGIVAAIDDTAPAAVTDVAADVETGMVTWTMSADDMIVGMINYRGFSLPIPGVIGYVVRGGASPEAMIDIGAVPAGSSSFQVPQALIESLINQGLPAVLVDVVAMDGTNMTSIVPPLVVELVPTRKPFVDADGGPVYIVKLDRHGAMTPNIVDFEDFVAFTMAFNTDETHENWRVFVQADLNDDKMVNFDDFILFFGSYGKEAAGPAGKSLVTPMLGVNEAAELSLRLGSDRVVAGETMFVDVSLANVQALMGYGFVLNYDAEKFEFVEVMPAAEDLLVSSGGETPLLRGWSPEAGQVHVMNAIVNGSEVSGGGDIVRLVFRVLRDFEDNARFEIAEGLVFDPSQLANPLAGGVLDIQTTPTEFALLQNFPNPFNPDTTIGYELAESADVTLQIYNVVGQVVRTLIAAEPQSVGRYQVRWDGMDDRGTPVSSGIYFYQISAGKFQDVRKLMLLK